MQILLAPDKWKGSLSAEQAAGALATGFRKVFPKADIDIFPLADGGEGTSALFVNSGYAAWVEAHAVDAAHKPIVARYAWINGTKTAVIDSSAAAGLAMLPPIERNPMQLSTKGVGMLASDALKRGAKEIWIGLGGSATNDAGLGMAAALGWKFVDHHGKALEPVPANFDAIVTCLPPSAIPDCSFIGLTDVSNPLLGERGCSRVFAPQKGADEAMVEILERRLSRLASQVIPRGDKMGSVPGAGAAGGLGFGLMTFLNGSLKPGFESVADFLGLDERLKRADLIVTAEGSLDGQTLEGKGPAALALRAKKWNRPTVAFAGAISRDAETKNLFVATAAIATRPMPLEESHRDAETLLAQAAERAARWIQLGTSLARSRQAH